MINLQATKNPSSSPYKATPMDIVKEYSQETTLHGVRYTMNPSAAPLERLCWVLALLACIACAGVFINSAWMKYVGGPIITSVETTHYPLYNLPFPAITICPANKLRKTEGEKIISSYLNITLNNTTREVLWHVMSVFSIFEHPFYDRMETHLSRVKNLFDKFDNFNVSQFMLQTLPTCSELFLNCYWHGKKVECCEVLHIQRCEAGFCYSFNSLTSEKTKQCSITEELKENGRSRKDDAMCNLRRTTGAGTTTGFEVYFKGANKLNSMDDGQRDRDGSRILLHDPSEFPESGKGLLLPEGENMVFTVKVSPSVTTSSEGVRNLEPEERQCYFHDEKHLDIHHGYSQYGCLLECKLKHIAKTCHCRPYFAEIPENVPECSLKGLMCIIEFEKELRFFSPPKVSNKNPSEENSPLQCSHCLPTCRETTYQLQTSYDRDHHPSNKGAKGYLDVYFKDLGAVKYQRRLAFDGMDLLVSFGGIAGLFLGVSLLTVVELGYYLMRLGYAVYKSIHFRKRQSSTVKYPATSQDIPKFSVTAITGKISKMEQRHSGIMW